jgi:hypothetical protein
MEEIKQETNLTTCKKCQQNKIRIFIGKFPSKSRKYQDESGALWCGNICPPCNKERLKEVMRKKRAKPTGIPAHC